MPLRVIGAGFGRTGTNSLKLALEQLGFGPCHHMKEVGPNRNQINWFSKASKGEDVDWDEVFAGFGSAVDWPSAAYYEELANHYPDAKVVLSIRDPQGWYRSVSETIYALSNSIPSWLLWIPPAKRLYDMVHRTVWTGVFDKRFSDEAYAIQVFEQHIENVRQNIPAERLLLHSAKEGWEPLCAFLEVPIPDPPYPRVNEAGDIKRMVSVMRGLRWLPWLLIALLAWVLIA